MNSPADQLVDCPKCGGGWYLDVDEQGLPYTCFVCGNTGYVTATVAESYDRPPVDLDDSERYGDRQERMDPQTGYVDG